jgi:ribosomal protein L40E
MPFGEVFENAWDCDHCGSKGISALTHKTCPICGAASPGSDKEYIADLNHPLVDYAALQMANQAEDWTCRFCQTRNSASRTSCTQCGSDRSEADQTVSAIDYGASAPTAAPVAAFVGKSEIAYKPDYRKRVIVGGVIAVLIALLGFIVFELLHTTSVQGQVVGFSWTRVVNIDSYQTIHESGRYVPSNGRIISQHQVIDHYNNTYRTEHVSKTCYRNKGNGSSVSYDCGYNRQVLVSSFPVYATQYDYLVDRWQPSRHVTATADDHNPYWPQYTLANNGAQSIGAERVNSNNETYTVKFADASAKKQYSLNTSLQEWAQYQPGTSYPLVLNFRGDVVNDPLKPNNAIPTATPEATRESTLEPTSDTTLDTTLVPTDEPSPTPAQ